MESINKNVDESFNGLLVDAVESYPVLWDNRHPQHKDNACVRKCWLEISGKLNEPDDFVKTRWRSLRDRYRREVKKCITTSGQATNFTPKWGLFAAMDFLRPTVMPRSTISNIKSPTLGELSQVLFEEELTDEVFEDSSNTADLTDSFIPCPSSSTPGRKRSLTSSSAGSSSCKRQQKNPHLAESEDIERALLRHLDQQPIPTPPTPTAEDLFYSSIAKQVMVLSLEGRLHMQIAVLNFLTDELKKEGKGRE